MIYTNNGQDARRTENFKELLKLGIEPKDLDLCYKFMTKDFDHRLALIAFLQKGKIKSDNFKYFFAFYQQDYVLRLKIAEYFITQKAPLVDLDEITTYLNADQDNKRTIALIRLAELAIPA